MREVDNLAEKLLSDKLFKIIKSLPDNRAKKLLPELRRLKDFLMLLKEKLDDSPIFNSLNEYG